jgi:cytoskeletal protein RodZ
MDTMNKAIGETLRDGRLKQRLSIAECAKRTHISARFLEALEEERWTVLPSESHRIGFLRLYARFLGVYSEDVMELYRTSQQAATPIEKTSETPRVAPHRAAPRGGSFTWQTLSLLAILGLIAFWGFYHGLRRYMPEQHMDLSFLKFKPKSGISMAPSSTTPTPRLITSTTKREIPVQRIRAKAEADSWLRVADNHQLIFEGILPAGAEKVWSGPGPFSIKVGNTNALSLFWNDQPVDIKSAARGHVADLRLPPERP